MKNLKLNQTQALINRVCGQGVTMAIATAALATVALSTPQQALAFFGFDTLHIQDEENDGECTTFSEAWGTGGQVLVQGSVTGPFAAFYKLDPKVSTLTSNATRCSYSGNYKGNYSGGVLIDNNGNMLVSHRYFANGGLYVQNKFELSPNLENVAMGNNLVTRVASGGAIQLGNYNAANMGDLALLSSMVLGMTPTGATTNGIPGNYYASLSGELIRISSELVNSSVTIGLNVSGIISGVVSLSTYVANFRENSWTATQSSTLSSQIAAISSRIAGGTFDSCNVCTSISAVLRPGLTSLSSQLNAVLASPQVANTVALSANITATNNRMIAVSSLLNAIIAGGTGGFDANKFALVSASIDSTNSDLNNKNAVINSLSTTVSAWGSAVDVTNISNNINTANSSLTVLTNNINVLRSVAGNGAGVVTGGTSGSTSGQNTQALGTGSLALGNGAIANTGATNAVAAGAGSVANNANEFSVGNASTGLVRRITNVAAPVNTTDAATKGYIDSLAAQRIAQGGTINTTTVKDAQNAVSRTAARGGVLAGAMAQIPQVDTTRTVGIGAGWANTKDANGFAVGASARVQDMLVVKGSYAFSNGDKGRYVKGKGMWGVGGLAQW